MSTGKEHESSSPLLRMHWEMSSLQSDFKRHSLINLLGPVELRVFIKSNVQMSLAYS
jgi:hypothetical protein